MPCHSVAWYIELWHVIPHHGTPHTIMYHEVKGMHHYGMVHTITLCRAHHTAVRIMDAIPYNGMSYRPWYIQSSALDLPTNKLVGPEGFDLSKVIKESADLAVAAKQVGWG